jgi:hypothetical protein
MREEIDTLDNKLRPFAGHCTVAGRKQVEGEVRK